MTDVPQRAESKRIVAATAVAAAVAGALLVTVILPAEYGIDPLGTGRVLGLTALSGTETTGAPAPSAAPQPKPAVPGTAVRLAQDVYTVELRPFEGVEYKYRMEENATLVYAWEGSTPVEFEFHGEPDGAPEKYFDSYSKGTSASGQGAFTAARSGVHGWYWKNHGEGRVTLTLRSSGFFTASTEYRDGEKIQRTFPRPTPSSSAASTPSPKG